MVQTPENFHLELVHILDFRVQTLESRTPESHPLTDPMAPWVCIPARLSVPSAIKRRRYRVLPSSHHSCPWEPYVKDIGAALTYFLGHRKAEITSLSRALTKSTRTGIPRLCDIGAQMPIQAPYLDALHSRELPK
jgi:hypothetical protein